jgi:hypothetical protein
MATGVTLIQSGKPETDAAFFRGALEAFRGRQVKGGFRMDDPPRGGFGEWVQTKSKDKRLNRRALTPRHGSFMAAILCSEGEVKSQLKGVAAKMETFLAGTLERVKKGNLLN